LFDLREVAGLDAERCRERLQAAVDDLPRDPHATTVNRYRRYSPAILLPWHLRLDWVPNLGDPDDPYTEYFQGDYNPEYAGVIRQFPPLSDELKSDCDLHQVVLHDWSLTFWHERLLTRPFIVGVHLIKLMVSEAGVRAVSSPDHLHQDGEPFTFVHLVARENAVGAHNVIAEAGCSGCQPEGVPPEAILDEFQLLRPLESYGVHDQAISHYVSSLERGPEERPAVRAALLVDFTPLLPSI
jgi:hypothetical protein